MPWLRGMVGDLEQCIVILHAFPSESIRSLGETGGVVGCPIVVLLNHGGPNCEDPVGCPRLPEGVGRLLLGSRLAGRAAGIGRSPVGAP